jgi:hypothetical protein
MLRPFIFIHPASKGWDAAVDNMGYPGALSARPGEAKGFFLSKKVSII